MTTAIVFKKEDLTCEDYFWPGGVELGETFEFYGNGCSSHEFRVIPPSKFQMNIQDWLTDKQKLAIDVYMKAKAHNENFDIGVYKHNVVKKYMDAEYARPRQPCTLGLPVERKVVDSDCYTVGQIKEIVAKYDKRLL